VRQVGPQRGCHERDKEEIVVENNPFFALGNAAWNAILIGALAALINRWMSDMKEKVSRYCDQNRQDHKEIYEELSSHDRRITTLETKVAK
jgi:hypothetical protein